MKTLAFVLVVALGAAGCSKKSGDAGSCESAVGAALDRLAASRAGSAMPPEMMEFANKVKGVIVKRCTEDKWADDVIGCYAKAGNMADIRTCRNKLPAELSEKLKADEMQVMGGMMRGKAGIPMHGTPPPPMPAPGPATPSAPAGSNSGSGSGG